VLWGGGFSRCIVAHKYECLAADTETATDPDAGLAGSAVVHDMHLIFGDENPYLCVLNFPQPVPVSDHDDARVR
jgi:hypothetical protein